jgi:hypothetical protein
LSDRGRFAKKRRLRFHPAMFEDILGMAGEADEPPITLIVMAGYFREDFPWLAELLTESYREIRDRGPKAADRVLSRLHRSIRAISHGPLNREMMGSSKEAFMMMEELPMMLDMTIHRMRERPVTSKPTEEPTSGSE